MTIKDILLSELAEIRKELAEIKTQIEELKPKRKAPVEIHPKYTEFIQQYNRLFRRNAKGDTKSKQGFAARLKEGYTVEDFVKAMQAAMADDYHVENKHKYLTPEYFTRSDKLARWLLTETNEKRNKHTTYSDLQNNG